ncbi:MAG: hydroxyethylthiazole kinase [Flavobacteriaceae bacterium]
MTPAALRDRAADAFACLRERRPAVHCLTNTVAQAFTANCLLALGCYPSMTDSKDEVKHFVAAADALLVNLGTLSMPRSEAIGLAIDAAQKKSMPWVLDPVFVELSPPRAEFARRLLFEKPAIVRGNAREIAALVGAAPEHAARQLAGNGGLVVVETGEVDTVSDVNGVSRIANGTPLLASITASGCAGAAITAALHAVDPDPTVAAVAGLLVTGIAGEQAAADSAGPGSFVIHFIDRLSRLRPEDIVAHAKVST